jgi:hypothetical protein
MVQQDHRWSVRWSMDFDVQVTGIDQHLYYGYANKTGERLKAECKCASWVGWNRAC